MVWERYRRKESTVTWPRLWQSLVVTSATAAISVVAFLVGAGGSHVSPTLDEPVDVASFNVFLESGWYVHPGVDLSDPVRDPSSNVFVYGPGVYHLAHGLQGIFQDDAPALATLSTEEQQTRKWILQALLVLAVLSMVWSLVLASQLLWVGFLGGAVLVSIPVFSGHAMFNIKDFPLAAGLTMVVSGIVGLSSTVNKWGTIRFLLGVGLVSIGLFVSVGTRPAFILIPGMLGVVAVVGNWLIGIRSGVRLRAQWHVFLGLGLGMSLGYLLLVLQYPKLFARPISLLNGSVSQASGFPWGGVTLTAGELAPNRPGLLYVIQWVGAQLPVAVTVLAVVGVTCSVWLWIRCLSPKDSQVTDLNRAALIGSGLWMTVGLGIPTAVAITDPVLYNGIRQLLFILPAFAFLSTIGLWMLMRAVDVRWSPHLSVGLVAAFVLLAVVLPVIGQFRLFPYSYTGLNTLAVRDGVDGRWETDYWGVSTGELRRTGLEAKEQGLLPSWFLYPPDYCGDASYSGRWKEPAGVEQSAFGGEAFYFCQVRSWGRNTPPEGCEVGWSVERPQLWRQSTMSLIAKCPFSGGPVPEGGINFAVESKDGVLQSAAEPVLLWGWQLSPDLGVYSNSASVGLGFDVPIDFRMRDLEVEFDLKVDLPDAEPLSVMIRVNGEPLGTAEFDEQSKEQNLRLTIPAQVVDRSENDLLVIRIDEMNGTEAPMFLFPQELKLTPV